MYKGLYFFLAFVLSGSIAVAGQNQQQGKNKDLDKILQEFNYPPAYEIVSEKALTNKNAACMRFEVQLRTDYPGNPNDAIIVDAVMYLRNENSTATAKMPFVVQLPPMGGINVLDKWMGQDLCNREIASFIIKNDFTGFDDQNAPPVDDHNHAFRRTAAAVKAAFAYGRDHGRIDETKFGLFGVSLGGILGSFVYGIEDQISTSYFLVSGSDVPYILAHSQEKRVSRLRRIRMQEEGFNDEQEYEDYLRQYLEFDPEQTAVRPPTETLNLVISTNDKNVPTEKQYELQTAFGVPTTHYSNKSHVGTVINTLLWKANRQKVIDFYVARFQLENPRETAQNRQQLAM